MGANKTANLIGAASNFISGYENNFMCVPIDLYANIFRAFNPFGWSELPYSP
jgi:hypothetical protein